MAIGDLGVRVRLDDEAFARSLPAGSAGMQRSDRVPVAHVIHKVLLLQIAITNDGDPF